MAETNTNSGQDQIDQLTGGGGQQSAEDSMYFVVPPKSHGWFAAKTQPAPVPEVPKSVAETPSVVTSKKPTEKSVAAPVLTNPASASWAPPQVTQGLANKASGKSSRGSLVFVTLLVLVLMVGGAYAGYVFWWQPRHAAKEAVVPKEEPAPEPKEEPKGFSTANPEWLESYFNVQTCVQENVCGDDADPDHDGLTNVDEFSAGTDPNNPDSDNDGLADGDEVNIFGGSPLNQKTAGDSRYTDADDARGGYDTAHGGTKLTPEQITEIGQKIATVGLHQPSIATLGEYLEKYTGPSLPEGVDASSQKQLERDVQRLATMRAVGAALVQFGESDGVFRDLEDWEEATAAVKPLLEAATSLTDPINQGQFVYKYETVSEGQSFVLSYYSETQKREVRYTKEQAQSDMQKDDARLRDTQRQDHLEQIRQALLIAGAAASSDVSKSLYPEADSWQTELAPKYLADVPQDPQSEQPYEYKPSADRRDFTLSTKLEVPPPTFTMYVCDANSCTYK